LSSTTDFIAELVRAANEVEKLSEDECARLLDHASLTILKCRDQVGVDQVCTDRDPAADFLILSGAIPLVPDEEIKAALLEAAGIIRHLHIALDMRTKIPLEEPPKR
jgi:hypothetical protein